MQGMSQAAAERLRKPASIYEVGLVVPHQANLRIIEAVAKRCGMPMERVF